MTPHGTFSHFHQLVFQMGLSWMSPLCPTAATLGGSSPTSHPKLCFRFPSSVQPSSSAASHHRAERPTLENKGISDGEPASLGRTGWEGRWAGVLRGGPSLWHFPQSPPGSGSWPSSACSCHLLAELGLGQTLRLAPCGTTGRRGPRQRGPGTPCHFPPPASPPLAPPCPHLLAPGAGGGSSQTGPGAPRAHCRRAVPWGTSKASIRSRPHSLRSLSKGIATLGLCSVRLGFLPGHSAHGFLIPISASGTRHPAAAGKALRPRAPPAASRNASACLSHPEPGGAPTVPAPLPQLSQGWGTPRGHRGADSRSSWGWWHPHTPGPRCTPSPH